MDREREPSPVLDVNGILKILPHRYPFLLIDKVLEIDLEKGFVLAQKNLTINEAFFQGHFPDAPIMPGVLILEAMAQAGGILVHKKGSNEKIAVLLNVNHAKFRHPVKPGDVFFLSFWVILTNLLFLRAWRKPLTSNWIACGCVAAAPYLFGFIHLHYHASQRAFQTKESLGVLLVQPAFPLDLGGGFKSREEALSALWAQWNKIFDLLLPYHPDPSVELIVLPEYVIPYGAYTLLYPLEEVYAMIHQRVDQKIEDTAFPAALPFVDKGWTGEGSQWMATNAFFTQFIANLFQAHVVIGLEDHERSEGTEKIDFYSSALHFRPQGETSERYAKRVLMPMGEYIPFDFCRQMAAKYGIGGSFTPGDRAKLFAAPVPIGPTICYEETFGHLMRDNRLMGAELLVNLTNDGWYPHSRLPLQHFEHARLRTVESGIPLARACNTGVTGVIDCFGRTVSLLNVPEEGPGVLKCSVPRYHYQTLYSLWGDYFVLSGSLLSLAGYFFLRKRPFQSTQ